MIPVPVAQGEERLCGLGGSGIFGCELQEEGQAGGVVSLEEGCAFYGEPFGFLPFGECVEVGLRGGCLVEGTEGVGRAQHE